jgi:hypothetical protein
MANRPDIPPGPGEHGFANPEAKRRLRREEDCGEAATEDCPETEMAIQKHVARRPESDPF